MPEQFETLPEEKKQRIINAALKEFSARDFKNASTARIAEEAGISKGALFLYFQTKKHLYLYLYRYALDVIKTEFAGKLDPSSRDPIDVLTAITRLKLDILRIHPDLYDFFVKLYFGEPDEELKATVHSDSDAVRGGMMSELLSGLDYSGFRRDLPPEMVMNIIKWVIDGYTDDMIRSFKTQDASLHGAELLNQRFGGYLQALRKAFYREQTAE